ncbi:hypothetical protein HG530_001886 [Fusarium avenaceum]|nr:hypothetical protein HG530_001886 [Fusarium avenaceum]
MLTSTRSAVFSTAIFSGSVTLLCIAIFWLQQFENSFQTSPSSLSTTLFTNMILPVDLQSAQIHNNDEAPATSAEISEPARYQVFHIEHSPGSHKLFIPTSPPRPLGYIYHVTYMPFTENPQPTLHLVCDILSSPHNIGDVHDTQFVGSIASQELDHVNQMAVSYGFALLSICFSRTAFLSHLRLSPPIVVTDYPGTTTPPTVFTSDFTPIIPTGDETVSQ